MMTATEYQNLIIPLLSNKLQGLEVVGEWRAFRGINYQYSPRVDIVVGPFSVAPNNNQTAEYNDILRNENTDRFLKRIYDYHVENISNEWLNEIQIPEFDYLTRKNQNARCFLSIEIENSSTRKHIMGSMINAASLGRIGIGIAYNESVKRTFIRILNYMAFLKRVEKNTYDTTNFMILTKEQFQELVTQ
ncbi:hypothetical protein [Tenacibaculum aquimarinum]|uniref:hypothetical protein n=1 Tax=Tenacibaculum aquimarinum TaxID=2910675 RepID=UPI001F0B67D8|nr:hypothetical protein [Tenacibaculum aquimarinum]MCH3885675.1 hypothetical protein [Tenacibaculum aquimarinum]